MYFDDLRLKEANGEYKTKLPYPMYDIQKQVGKEKFKQLRKEYREDESRLRNLFAIDCRVAFENEIGKLLTENQWRKVFDKAWDDGHAEGLYNVINQLESLYNLVYAFVH